MNAYLELMVFSAIGLLDDEKEPVASENLLFQMDVLRLLPKERPPVVIGAGHTVRRPIPKIGRNAPCYCGSGKKYKKCCINKEQELLRDASPYAGVTMSQLRDSPQLASDDSFIEEMRAYDLKKLNPPTLNLDQLFTAYRRCNQFGLRVLAFDMLKELERRPDNHDFDKEHFVDLMDSAIAAGEIDLAEKIYHHIPSDILLASGYPKDQFKLLKNNETLKKIEGLKGEIGSQQQIRRSLRAELRRYREKSLKAEEESTTPDRHNADVTPTSPEIIKSLIVPEYSEVFRQACKSVPSPVAAKAIRAIGEFATADKNIWRITRPIKRIDQCYRIRIGRNCRLMLQWEPDKSIQALDLIPRGELESWIRKHC